MPGHKGRKNMILSYEEFREEFTKAVLVASEVVPEVGSVDRRKLCRSNRGYTDALSLKIRERDIAPVIYPKDAYEHYRSDGRTPEMLAAEMVANAVKAALEGISFDIGDLCPKNASDHLFLQLLNGDINRDLAGRTAHLNLHDLIAVPRWKTEGGSILCSRDIERDLLGFSDEEILETALKNTLECEFAIRGMTEYLCMLTGQKAPEVREQMFLVLGDEYISGTAAMLSEKMLQKISIAVESENYYVIPSSVYEIIIVPEHAVDDPDTLKHICRDINRTVLEPQDFLSDSIYRYEASSGKLTL